MSKMKNIVILGVARSGKTTLSRMITEKFSNYQILNGDCIRSTFQKVFPEVGINKFKGHGMKNDFALFCSELFKNEIKYNKNYYNYIFESCDISPYNARKFFCNNDTSVIFLIYPSLNVNEIIYNYKYYAEKGDYMLKKTEEEILDRAQMWLEKSKQFKLECEQNNIRYIDVSYNRNEVFKKIIDELCGG